MNNAPGESSDDPESPPPVLDYRGPDKEWPQEPRIPNPAATRSLRCGLGLFGLVALAYVTLALPALVRNPLGMCIVVAWFVLMAMALGFGIAGIRRAREPNVAGRWAAMFGLGLGVTGSLFAGLLTWLALVVAPQVHRAYCVPNLRQIGQACVLYANDNGGQFPPHFGAIMEDLTPGCLVCPGSDDTPATGPTTQAVLADFAKPGRCSYIYLGTGLTTAVAPNTPIACDRPNNHRGKGIHVLYADGTVNWLVKQQAEAFFANLPATRPAR